VRCEGGRKKLKGGTLKSWKCNP